MSWLLWVLLVVARVADAEPVHIVAHAHANPCATGVDPNAVGMLSERGAVDQYRRPSGAFSRGCRTTTIVDFAAGAANFYLLQVRPDFRRPIRSEAECAASRLWTRVERWNAARGRWEQLHVEGSEGRWKGKRRLCVAPTFDFGRMNHVGGGRPETSRYRVSTWARDHTDAYVAVTIRGTNRGD